MRYHNITKDDMLNGEGLREVETHHCLEFGVAGDDALVEIIVGFVEVAFGDVVAGVLFEEAFAARTQRESGENEVVFQFHNLRL